MSVLLLIERQRVGLGPKIPLRESYSKVRVEGLAAPAQLNIHTSYKIVCFTESGVFPLETFRGSAVQAEIIEGPCCVTVQLED